MKNYAQPKHGENVHLNKKHHIKESHTVRISSVEQRNNQSLIHRANRRRKTRAKGRQSDRQNREKKREKERNTKERNTNLMVTLLLLVTLSLEAKLLLGEEEASAKLFPDDKLVDLVPETCVATGTTQAVTVTLTADTHAISLLLFCPDFFPCSQA
jgi:cation transport ATPase